MRIRRGKGVGSKYRPNILFVMTDQQRWDALGCSGGWVNTPNFDRIAAQGTLFPNAYTNSPVCIPARVSLATGRYPHQLNLWNNRRYTLSPNRRTWMSDIREAGYRTSLFGKTHLHPQKGDLRDRLDLVRSYGLDDVDEIAGPKASVRSRSNLIDQWIEADVYRAYKQDLRERYAKKPWLVRPTPLPFDLYPDVYVGRQARDYLRAYDRPQPWFCWVSFVGPHEPWDTPEPYASMYEPSDMPGPTRPVLEQRARPAGLLDQRLAGPIPFEEGDVASMRANYAGHVSLIDDRFGEILEMIESRGELSDTVVAVVSDHGEMNGDHGLIYKKNFLNGAVRIPFVIRLPDRLRSDGNTGVTCPAPVELMDVGATLATFAGANMGKRSKARNVLSFPEALPQKVRDHAVSEFRRERMIATTKWKLALNREGEPYLLFSLEDDADETRNLAGLPEVAGIERQLIEQLADR